MDVEDNTFYFLNLSYLICDNYSRGLTIFVEVCRIPVALEAQTLLILAFHIDNHLDWVLNGELKSLKVNDFRVAGVDCFLSNLPFCLWPCVTTSLLKLLLIVLATRRLNLLLITITSLKF